MWMSWGGIVAFEFVDEVTDVNFLPPYEMRALMCGEK